MTGAHSAEPPSREPAHDRSPEELREELGELRAELGETVEELAHRVDVPARVRAKREETAGQVRAKRDEAITWVRQQLTAAQAALAEKAPALEATLRERPALVAVIPLGLSYLVSLLRWRRRRRKAARIRKDVEGTR